jgi:outer membrane autotransporter protein
MREALWLGRRLLLWTIAVTTALSLHVVPVHAQQQQISIFEIPALLKFKLNEDDPQQTPIGKPISQIFIAAALLFLPTVLSVVGNTLFGPPDNSSTDTAGQALSCPVFAGAGTLLTEDSCIWAKVSGQWVSQTGMTNSAALFRIGGQKEIAPGLFLGGAFGAGRSWVQDDNGNNGAGQLFDGSVSLKHTIGPWLVAGALSFRTSATHFAGNLLQSDVNVYTGGLRLRGSYDFAFDGWYLRPRLDLDLLHMSRPGFTENAQGIAVLAVDGFTETSFAVTPTVELGGRFAVGEKTILRPYIAAGASYVPTNQNAVSATFVGPLAGLGAFQATFSTPSVFANLEAGLQLYRERGVEVKVEYTLSAGNNYLSQGASLRGTWHF